MTWPINANPSIGSRNLRRRQSSISQAGVHKIGIGSLTFSGKVKSNCAQLFKLGAMDNSNQLVNRYVAEKCEQFTIVKLRLEQLLRIFCALQTSQVLHISMNAQLTCHNNFNLMVKMLLIFPLLRFCTLVILVQENISLRYKRSCLRLVKKPIGEIMRGNKLYFLIDYKILEGFGSCRHERAQ